MLARRELRSASHRVPMTLAESDARLEELEQQIAATDGIG
jgi:hypothetical protein